jgi:cytochrome P450
MSFNLDEGVRYMRGVIRDRELRERLARMLDERAGTACFVDTPPMSPFDPGSDEQARYERYYAASIKRRRQVHYDTADAILELLSTEGDKP